MTDKPVPLVYSGLAPAHRVSGVTYIGQGSSDICFVKKYQLKNIWTYLLIKVY